MWLDCISLSAMSAVFLFLESSSELERESKYSFSSVFALQDLRWKKRKKKRGEFRFSFGDWGCDFFIRREFIWKIFFNPPLIFTDINNSSRNRSLNFYLHYILLINTNFPLLRIINNYINFYIRSLNFVFYKSRTSQSLLHALRWCNWSREKPHLEKLK